MPEEDGCWVTSDCPASLVVVNPLNSHYENGVRHLEEIYRARPPLNQDLLGAPHSFAEAIENMFGQLERRTGVHEPRGWASVKLEAFGIGAGPEALERLSRLRKLWNQDKHGSRERDAVEAFQVATPEFAVEVLNLTGALLAAFFFRADGSRADWIRIGSLAGGKLELTTATEADQRELMSAWGITVEGF